MAAAAAVPSPERAHVRADWAACLAVATSLPACWLAGPRFNFLVLPLRSAPCRCGFVFCSGHRHAQDHACAFDFASMDKANLAKANTKVVAAKVDKL